MFKKVFTLLLVVVLTAAAAIGGTLAYLQSEDSDVNVMTLGSVKIDQIEQERDENGKLVSFTQAKPLYPAVFEGSSIPWAAEDKWPVEGVQAWKVVEDNANVLDKFVTVENTGISPAYVRTIIAYEGNEEYGPNGDWIHIVTNGDNVPGAIATNFVGYVNVDGVEYTVYEYVYTEALASGETTIPSLKQVYMNNMADNDVVAKYGETYDILVVSQAVQTAGFDAPAQALNTAFGEVNETNVKHWFEGGEFAIPEVANTADELKAALTTENNNVILGSDITLEKGIAIANGVTVNMNGHTITDSSTGGRTFAAQKGAIVTFGGDGVVQKDASVASDYAMPFYVSNGTLTVEGGTYNMGAPAKTNYSILAQNSSKLVINDGTFTNTANYPLFYAIYSSIIEINGGYFESIGAENPDLLDLEYHETRISKIIIKGGTFVNYNPLEDNEGLKLEADSNGVYEARVIVAEGYKVVSETQPNGDVWYTVVAE